MQISAIRLQSGSYALWMGMYAAVSKMRAVVEAGPEVVVESCALRCISSDAQSGVWRIKWCGRIWRRGWRDGAWIGVDQALA